MIHKLRELRRTTRPFAQKCAEPPDHLRTFRGALVAETALCRQQCFFFTHVSLHTRGDGQTCSMEESFAENQKHQRAAKPVCSVNTNTVKNASFTLNVVP